MRILFLCLVLLLWAVKAMAQPQLQSDVPQRIIALAPHITELLYAVGAGEQLVAVSDYSDYPAAANRLPKVAGYQGIDLEAVLALRPDLIIAWRAAPATAELQRLQQLGIRIVYSDPQTLQGIIDEVRHLGELTGKKQQALQLADKLTLKLQELTGRYSAKMAVPVFFAMDTELLTTVAANSMVQQILALCGADNPFAVMPNDYPRVSLEQVLHSQPELIIQAGTAAMPANFSYWQRFRMIPAVKKKQFLAVNADELYRMTPRTFDAAAAVCEGVEQVRQRQ